MRRTCSRFAPHATARRDISARPRVMSAAAVLWPSPMPSRERMAELSAKALETLVEAAASGKKLEFKKLDEMAAGEAQIRALGQAIERLTEHLIPLAQVLNPSRFRLLVRRHRRGPLAVWVRWCGRRQWRCG